MVVVADEGHYCSAGDIRMGLGQVWLTFVGVELTFMDVEAWRCFGRACFSAQMTGDVRRWDFVPVI